jgi:hypothetical protein
MWLSDYGVRLACLAAVAGTAGVGRAADAAAAGTAKSIPPERQFTVSAAFAGAAAERNEALARFFVERLPLGRTFAAQPAPPCSWQEVPKNLTASTHVNVLQMNFGHRRELLALMLDAPGGCVAVAARATALDGQDGKYYYTFTAPPGDYQLPENVPPDLVNNFAVAFDARSATQGVCRLIVRAWDGEAREAPALADALQAQPAADNLAAAQLHPLMAAALYAEGWRASSDPQPQTLFLGVKQEALFFDLRATWYLGNRGSCTVTHRRIRGEQLFDSLRILFQHASAWQAGVKECINLGLAGAHPCWVGHRDAIGDDGMEYRECLVVAKQGNGFTAVNAATGDEIWSSRGEETKSATPAGKGGLLFEYDSRGLRRLSPTNGTADVTIPVAGLASARQFDARDDLTILSVGAELMLFERDRERWRVTLPSPVLAGPVLAGARVLAGDSQGGLICLAVAGQEQWRARLPKPVTGAIAAVDGLILASSDEGTLFAVGGDDGRLRWQAELGDVMLGVPVSAGEAILAASKARKLFLFDKTDGRLRRSHTFDTWLLGVHVADGRVFCVDLRRRLSVFDAATLTLQHEWRFPFAFDPEPLDVTGFSTDRQSLDLTDAAARGILWTDIKGNHYLVPLP